MIRNYLLNAFSVQAVAPSKEYGQPARLPLQLSAAQIFARVTLPADIPANAIVTQADLVWGVADAYPGATITFRIKRYATRFDRPITWARRPAVTGSETSVAVTDPTASTKFVLSVIPDVQGFISGTIQNFGWQIYITTATLRHLDGARAATHVPYLHLAWVLPGEPPEELSPAGRIATGTPELTFVVPEDTTHIQVQIDDDDTFATPVHDSTMTAFSGDTVASYTPPGAAIPDGSTRYWRARCWRGGIPSEWSAAAELIRDDLETFTITAPGSTTGDPAAEVTWTAIANQTAFQAQLYDHTSGKVVADSGRVAGTDTSWTPPSGLRGEGDATWTVQLWDDKEDRVPTTGVPVYSEATHDFAVNAGGSDDGPTELNVTQRGGTPIIDLDITFAVAPAGGVQIIRTVDGENTWLARIPYAGAHTMWADRTAPRFKNVLYKALAVTAGGVVSNVGDAELIFPRSSGIWLLDPDADFDDTAAAVLLGKDQLTADMSEQAVLHAVTGRAPVRRRLGTPPPAGEFGRSSHVLMDALGLTADQAHEQLMAWKTNDAGTVYRLVFGTWNIPVTVGNIQSFPTALSGDETQYDAGFQWWQTDDELPWS